MQAGTGCRPPGTWREVAESSLQGRCRVRFWRFKARAGRCVGAGAVTGGVRLRDRALRHVSQIPASDAGEVDALVAT